ncbi:hypothetical protein Misp01_53100 [Microtetraspora sp. NBRC 13810]|uniref:hypothetical protein n=1 Tax=Microtetraspora sp. NBRC 13810 TaxID=3030990 RepID=UPI002552AC3B|nr:hypothetical protein [Microtetraspora sp. NBRC 13810]GLW10181.1 hypothetical protein Misp01_53100 [Microtetraspora sp. NBRC 13810]
MSYGAVQGRFEAGKVDNSFSAYDAGGVRWLVMTLELWPRTEVVNWAGNVVAARHSNTTDPVRLVEIDTRADSLRTWIYGPYDNRSFTEYDRSFAGLGLVRWRSPRRGGRETRRGVSRPPLFTRPDRAEPFADGDADLKETELAAPGARKTA